MKIIKKRLQSIGNTRWWSKELALKHLFGSDSMYITIILALKSIDISNGFTPKAKLKANTLKNSILDYSTILTAFIYIRIFNFVGSLSKYIQTKSMDLLKFQEMVYTAIKDLTYVQRDMDGVKVMAKRFIDNMSEKLEFLENEDIDIITETELSLTRSKKQKILSSEKNNDELIIDPKIKFTVEVHNFILDNTIACIEKKFSKNQILYIDFVSL